MRGPILIDAIPFAALGTIYSEWQDAPAGALIVLGGFGAFGSSQDWKRYTQNCIGIRADSALGPLIVCISPEPKLVLEQKKAQGMFMSNIHVATGPAMDVARSHHLAVGSIDLQKEENATSGFVYRSQDRSVLAVEYPDYANRGLVLEGNEVWKVTEFKPSDFIRVGKLIVNANE